MTTIIHVDKRVIAQNKKKGTDDPPLLIRYANGDIRRAHEIKVHGVTNFVHRNDAPLPSGARLWVETNGEVEIVR